MKGEKPAVNSPEVQALCKKLFKDTLRTLWRTSSRALLPQNHYRFSVQLLFGDLGPCRCLMSCPVKRIEMTHAVGNAV